MLQILGILYVGMLKVLILITTSSVDIKLNEFWLLMTDSH